MPETNLPPDPLIAVAVSGNVDEEKFADELEVGDVLADTGGTLRQVRRHGDDVYVWISDDEEPESFDSSALVRVTTGLWCHERHDHEKSFHQRRDTA